MEYKRCPGCMGVKVNRVCEHCGYDEQVQNAVHQLPIGTRLKDQYVIGKVLGQGGFGITYLGWDAFLEIPVAIKEYYPTGMVMRDATISLEVTNCEGQNGTMFEHNRKRFLREAQSLAKLSSVPEVVQVKGYFAENGTAYIVMEYIQGVTLKELLKRNGPMSGPQAMAVFRPVMEGLQKVHEVGLVHRDISPDNIMILPSGNVKLLDFGAVRDYGSAELSQSTQAILKPGFAPLEQYKSRGELGPWTDIYALCATMYYCMTGKLPPDAPERMLEGSELDWGQAKGLNPQQIGILQKGTALRAEERIQSAEELKTTLIWPGTRTVKEPPKEVPKKKKKKRGIGPAVLILLALVIGGAAVLLAIRETPGDGAEDAPEPPTMESTAPTEADPKPVTYILEYYADDLEVTVTEDRVMTVTVKDLELRDTYSINGQGSTPNRVDHFWGIYAESPGGKIEISTKHWPEKGDMPMEVPLEEINSGLWVYTDISTRSCTWIRDVDSVSCTGDSITWVCTIPQDTGNFDLNDIGFLQVSYLDLDTGEYVNRGYNVTEARTVTTDTPLPQSGTGLPIYESGYHEEHYTVELESTDEGIVVSGEGLYILLKNGRELQIMVDSVSVLDQYTTNRSESWENSLEYGWELQMRGKKGNFSVSTTSWASNPGDEQVKAPSEMQHSIWMEESGSYTNFGNVANVEYGDTYFVWNCTIPKYKDGDKVVFDILSFTEFEVRITDLDRDLNLTRTYSVE